MLPWTAYIFGFAAILITYFGGSIAIRLKNYINPLIAFCGGTLISLALIDLIPESLEILENTEPHNVLLTVIISFILTHFLDKLVVFHNHSHSEDCNNHNKKGIASVSGLGFHSFLDGLIIGAGFLVDNSTGILVSTVVLLHRFADGVNSVTLSVRNKHEHHTTKKLLVLNSLMPLMGIVVSGFLEIPNHVLGYILSVFAGFFLYIGATDLLPEAHKERSSVKLVFFTILGSLLVFIFSLISH